MTMPPKPVDMDVIDLGQRVTALTTSAGRTAPTIEVRVTDTHLFVDLDGAILGGWMINSPLHVVVHNDRRAVPGDGILPILRIVHTADELVIKGGHVAVDYLLVTADTPVIIRDFTIRGSIRVQGAS